MDEVAAAHRRATLMLVGSSTLFGIMAFCAKLASIHLSGAQVATLRFVIGTVPFLLVPTWRRESFTFQRFDLLFYRGFFGGLAVLLYFTAIEHIPVGLATLLNYTTPIFSGIFAALFIGEPIRPRTLIPLAIAFSGVYLVVRSHDTGQEVLGFGPWELVALFSAILSGAAVTSIRIARRTEGAWSIYASFSIFGLLATAPFAVGQWRTPTALDWVALAGVGIAAMAAQLLMTHAYRWVDTLTAGVIAQLAIVIAMILGALWLHETLSPMRVIGSLLTITGVVLVMTTGSPQKSATEPAAES